MNRIIVGLWICLLLFPYSLFSSVPSESLKPLFQIDSALEQAYLQELIELAKRKELAKQEQWLNLIHYKRNWLGKMKSQVAGRGFFLSKEGENNPEDELEATLRGFFTPEISTNNVNEKPVPRCQFPARYQWLKKELAINELRIPQVNCTRFLEFKKRLSAESVSLVFSSFYLNNPSSTFGHTFLRMNSSKYRGQSGEHFELLDHGINYAAEVNITNPILYAFFGLIGGFKGTFTNVPYYYKVREYNDFESRDLWSYELNLSPEELDMLIAHIWELGSTHYDYYYFTQNCSYHIFTTLEAAAPRLHLTEQLPFYVIPSDTVRVLYKVPHLVTKVTYRPSVRSTFHYRLKDLSVEEVNALKKIVSASDELSVRSLPTKESQAKVLDAGMDYLEFQAPNDLLENNTPTSKVKQNLLIARAGTGVSSHEIQMDPPLHEAPHLGHSSGRVYLEGVGANSSGGFSGLGIRFALHDFLDPDVGYPEGAQIEFMNVRGRYHWNTHEFQLPELTLFRITSLNPWSEFNQGASFRVQVGAQTFFDRNCDQCIGANVEGGPGLTLNPMGKDLSLYSFMNVKLEYSPYFHFSSGRVGVGPSFGILAHLWRDARVMANVGYSYYGFSQFNSSVYSQVNLRQIFGQKFALDFRGLRVDDYLESSVGGMWYF